MVATLQYIDDMLIKGGLEFLVLLGHLLLIGGPIWFFCTFFARFLAKYSPNGRGYNRLFMLFPLCIGIPYLLDYFCVIKSVYHEFEEFGQEFEKERFLSDSFEIFTCYLLMAIIPLYLLRFWGLKRKK